MYLSLSICIYIYIHIYIYIYTYIITEGGRGAHPPEGDRRRGRVDRPRAHDPRLPQADVQPGAGDRVADADHPGLLWGFDTIISPIIISTDH